MSKGMYRDIILEPLKRRLASYNIESTYLVSYSTVEDVDTLHVTTKTSAYFTDYVTTVPVQVKEDKVCVCQHSRYGATILYADPQMAEKLLAAVLKAREHQFNWSISDANGPNKLIATIFLERIDDRPVRCFTSNDHYHPIVFNFLRSLAKPGLPSNLHPNLEQITTPLIEGGINPTFYHLFPWDLWSFDYDQPIPGDKYGRKWWSHLGDDFHTSLFKLIGTSKRIILWTIEH